MINSKIKRIFKILSIIILLFIIQTFASKIGGYVAKLFDYSIIDSDNTFMNISVHHIVQMLIALLVIFIIHKTRKLNFNLKPKFSKTGILYTSIFSFVILIYVLISYIIGYSNSAIAPYGYDLNAVNILGTLGFQLLLSGTSEEILFRALPITVIGNLTNSKSKNILGILVASVLFSIAHIQWSLVPFTISFDLFQLIYAFVLGIAYGVTYIKSKSIIYPMIMHGMSNFLMVGIGYIFAVV